MFLGCNIAGVVHALDELGRDEQEASERTVWNFEFGKTGALGSVLNLQNLQNQMVRFCPNFVLERNRSVFCQHSIYAFETKSGCYFLRVFQILFPVELFALPDSLFSLVVQLELFVQVVLFCPPLLFHRFQLTFFPLPLQLLLNFLAFSCICYLKAILRNLLLETLLRLALWFHV